MNNNDKHRTYAVEGRAGLLKLDADELEAMYRSGLTLTYETRKSLERARKVIEEVLNDRQEKAA